MLMAWRTVIALNAALWLRVASNRLDIELFTAENISEGVEFRLVEGTQGETQGECFIKHLNSVCYCDKQKFRTGRFQCTGCKDVFKWGYGCELNCPGQCQLGCDMAGNCKRHVGCAHTSRIPGNEDVIVNSRGECQACHPGTWGYHCEKQCPENCEASKAEGGCTRGGQCYSCKEGWFGERCDRPCPEACPVCVQKDHTAHGSEPGTYLPAGACLNQCRNHRWGSHCDKECPQHCKQLGGVSCSTGLCDYGCAGDSFFGESCEARCSKGCKGEQCRQSDGACIKDGCYDGYWGSKCDQTCPERTLGKCRQEDGLPEACQEGFYPSLEKQPMGTPFGSSAAAVVASCKPCSENCKSKKCSISGECVDGCKEGAWGPRCESFCPANCLGPCDSRNTGYMTNGLCKACKVGFTGPRCDAQCHWTCKSCRQYSGNILDMAFMSPEGDGEVHCMACRRDEPVEFNADSGKCECINGATRPRGSFRCVCTPPDDEKKEAIFDKSTRQCIVKAKLR